MNYRIQAHLSWPLPDGHSRSHGLPTFVLEGGVLGIVNKHHAERIARDMLLAIAPRGAHVDISCVSMGEGGDLAADGR